MMENIFLCTKCHYSLRDKEKFDQEHQRNIKYNQLLAKYHHTVQKNIYKMH